MKKVYTRAVCLLVTVAMMFTVAGCGGTEDVWSEWIELVEVSEESDTLDSSEETQVSSPESVVPGSSSSGGTNPNRNIIHITEGGTSEYKIVVSLSNEGYDQGRLVQKVIKATSNVSVPLILDTESGDGPEIIIGDTTREESAAVMKTFGKNEYAIKTDKKGNVVIASTNAYGLEMATEKFLKDYFGYDPNATKAGTEKSVPINLNIKQSVFADYKLVWSDEFEGSAVDMNKWCFKAHMSAQTHLKLYHDERAVQVNGGNMNLIAGRIDDHNYWTNTSLSTADTMVFKYGYLEMRAKIPFGKPAFPSFWMQSSMHGAVDPYVMAEVDMFEHFCAQGNSYLQTGCHKWYRDGTGEHYVGPQIGSYTFAGEEIAEQWHTYALWWTPKSLNFLIDGELYHTINITDSGDFGERDDGMGCFHDYSHLIFNNYVHTASGKEEGGDKDNVNATPDDVFPLTYTIDYVRLYQIPGQGGLIDLTKNGN